MRGETLDHLTGARCLAALWIVCAHFMPKGLKKGEDSHYLNAAVFRVNIAVCFFVVASGFVTQWAYGGRDLSNPRALGQFYLRRLGRVVFTFWVSMAFACYVLTRLGTEWDLGYLLRCFLFLQQWVQWCPNGPSWFVFALLPSWLLYPVTRRAVAAVEARRGVRGLIELIAGLWVLSFGPGVALFLLQRGNVTMQQHGTMSFWPPAQLADFAIGVAAASLAQRQVAPREGSSGDDMSWVAGAPGVLADVALAAAVSIVFFLPRPSETWQLYLNGWEPLLDHGLAPLLAAFLYGASVAAAQGEAVRGSLMAKFLSHEALVGMGTYSFEVYIFQRPWHDTFRLFSDPTVPAVFVVYLLTLWIFAGVYVHFVQDPVGNWIREMTSGLALPGEFQREEYLRVDCAEPPWHPASQPLGDGALATSQAKRFTSDVDSMETSSPPRDAAWPPAGGRPH